MSGSGPQRRRLPPRGADGGAGGYGAIIQATLLRTTIHMVSRREFWRYAVGVKRQARRTWSPPSPGSRRGQIEPWSRPPRGSATPSPTGRAPSSQLGDLASGARLGGASPVGRPGSRSSVRDLGAPARRPARPRGGLGRPARRPRKVEGARASRPCLPARVRAGVGGWRDIGLWAGHLGHGPQKRGGEGLDARPLPRRVGSGSRGPARCAAAGLR